MRIRFPHLHLRASLLALCGVAWFTLAVVALGPLVFGPETFTREKGKPKAEVRTFAVTKKSNEYLLRVKNQGVTNAQIAIDGDVVLDTHDFTSGRKRTDEEDDDKEEPRSSKDKNKKIDEAWEDERRGVPTPLIERRLKLDAGRHKLRVLVRGKAGKSLTIEIFSPGPATTDTTPPTITASVSPAANPNGWHNVPVTVTFACADADSGVATCTAPVTRTADGAGQIVSGSATDNAGNTATASVTLNIDRTLPSISVSLTPPPPGSGWINTPVTAHFTCTDGGSGVTGCPGDQVVSAEGSNQTVTGTTTDRAGNTASVTSAPFNIDLGPPTISATINPTPNANGWNRSPVRVHFTCADTGAGIATCPPDQVLSADGTGLTVTGTAVDRAGNAASVTSPPVNIDQVPPVVSVSLTPTPGGWIASPVSVGFTCEDSGSGIETCPDSRFVSTDGANQTVTATAVDRAGNIAAVTSPPFDIDLTAPSIAVTLNPPPNANGWNKTPVTAHFTCADTRSGVATCPADVVVSTDGAGQTISGITTDSAGNTATASATVNIDRTPPTLTIGSPVAGAAFFTPSAPVSGTASDALSGVVSTTCNAAPATLAGSQLNCLVALEPGPNTVTTIVTDAAGNSTTASVGVAYTSLPRITLTSPANLTYVNISPTTVNGTVDDDTAVVMINAVAAPVVNGSFSVALPLAEGPNVITATATAAAGGTATASVNVTLDTAPPHVTITSPADQFLTTAESVSIAGVVNDIVVGTVNDEQARVTINGASAAVANRTFLAQDIPLAIGPNVIQAVALDRVGNSATTQIVVTRQAVTQSHIQLIAGNNQSGPIGTPLPAQLVVRLTDGAGNPAPKRQVIFKVTHNDGELASGSDPAPTIVAQTDADGQASARWTLGHRAGAGGNIAEAYSVGFEGTAVFTASGTQGVAGKIVVDTGNDQIGAIDEALPKPFIAVVIDEGNNRMAGVPVTFTVRQGGGNIAGSLEKTVITDSDGRAAVTLTLGLQEGNANNLVEANFPFNPAFGAAFTASGRAPGNPSETVISGVVLDNSNMPIAGVTVRAVLTNVLYSNLAAVAAAPSAQTNTQGQFEIPQAPVGLVKLVVDGTTAQAAGTYPSLEYDIVTVAGQSNNVGQPIYLVALNTANQLCVTPTTGGGTLTIPEAPGFSLTFGPGQVTFPGGSKTGCVSVTVVNGDKVPMVPGFGQQPRFIVTIQPSGAVFNPPAPITIPNVDGLAPRAVTEMYSFDHDIGSFVAIGTGVVSDDGLIIRSGQGVGVLKAGWHCGGDPNTTGTAATCPTCQTCQGTQCVNDNGQTPPQNAPDDCKKEICNGGGVVSQNDDSEQPTNNLGGLGYPSVCEKCQGGSRAPRADGTTPVSSGQCCFNGQPLNKFGQTVGNVMDGPLENKCPQRTQNTGRAHDIDGCSGGDPRYDNQNPMLDKYGAGLLAISNTAFGQPQPGGGAALPLPCNQHDICYQTCAAPGVALSVSRAACDNGMLAGMQNVCRTSYPATCPATLTAAQCTTYFEQRDQCFALADTYRTGLGLFGFFFAYKERQEQYCQCCP